MIGSGGKSGSNAEGCAHSPAGFCPKCHYPMDPGTCPECGTEVTEGSILTSLSQTRAAKTRRWAMRIFLFILLPAAAIYGAWHIPWPRFIPTDWMLAMNTTAKHWAAAELLRRFDMGRLSNDQADRFMNKFIHVELSMRKSAPNAPLIGYKLLLQTDMPMHPNLSAGVEVASLMVDGVQRSSWGPLTTFFGTRRSGSSVLENLGPGVHKIELHLLTTAERTNAPNTALHKVEHTVSHEITILDNSAANLVELVCNPDLTREVESSLMASRTQWACRIAPKRSTGPPIPIAGRVLWRPSGKGEFQDDGSFAWAGKGGIDLPYTVADTVGYTSAIDIRIVPDSNVAIQRLDESQTRIYGCTLEWTNVQQQNAMSTPAENPN